MTQCNGKVIAQIFLFLLKQLEQLMNYLQIQDVLYTVIVTTKHMVGTDFSINRTTATNSNIIIEYNFTSTEFSQSNITATLYNCIGSYIANGSVQAYSQSKNINVYSENGKIEINLHNLASGIYFCYD